MTGGRERFEASRRGNFTGIYTPRPLRSAVHALPSPVNAAPRISRTALALAPSPSPCNHAAVLCAVLPLGPGWTDTICQCARGHPDTEKRSLIGTCHGLDRQARPAMR